MAKSVLTPNHRYWKALCTRLNDMLTIYIEGKPHSKCQTDLRCTTKILKSLPGIDVEETLALYMKLGGHCDCEVLMNVEPNWNGS